jgi:CheY-like chemotaxis protein
MTSGAAAMWIGVIASLALAAVYAAVRWGRGVRAAERAATRALEESTELIRTMDASSRLAADLAHDVNDLLTAITGHAELLIAGMDPSRPAIVDAREILRAALSAAKLTKPLRSLADGQRASTGPAGVDAVMARTTQSLESMLSARTEILIVEDEPGIRELIRTVLSRAGYDVAAVAGPRAALAALARRPVVALLIVDLVMPEMDGYDLVAEARDLRADLPVIFMSGFAPDAKRHAAADRFMAKPFSNEALLEAVREALAASPVSPPPSC